MHLVTAKLARLKSPHSDLCFLDRVPLGTMYHVDLDRIRESRTFNLSADRMGNTEAFVWEVEMSGWLPLSCLELVGTH